MDNRECTSLLDQYFFDTVKPKLSSNDFDTIRDYTFNYFGTISSYFNDEIDDEETIKDVKKSIEVLRHAIKLCPLPIPLTVFHGTSSDILGRKGIVGRKKVSFKSNTFMSTSISFNVASVFSKFGRNNEPIILQIDLPKGYPALWVKPISGHDYEDELLLSNNTKLNVESYDESVNGFTIVKCNPIIK